jgi:simple sugar transport system substrate-binding protein
VTFLPTSPPLNEDARCRGRPQSVRAASGIPYLIYIGPDEYQGGVVAAKLVLAKVKPTKAVCLNRLLKHAGTQDRCRGWGDTLSAAGVASSVVDVSGEIDRAMSAVAAFIRENPDIDAFLSATSPPDYYEALLRTLKQELTDFDNIELVTFDLESGVIASIEAGETLASITQQPYLQGYLPAILARQYLEAELMPNDDIITGPDVVDAANVDQARRAKRLGRR